MPPLALAPTSIHSGTTLLPLGAMLLAGSLNALAQTANDADVKTLRPITIIEKVEETQGKDALRATTTIGKGKQVLRDIPQSITVVTEKLIDNRNLDTLKDELHNTAGVTFMAAEGGEEDIRLRGFPPRLNRYGGDSNFYGNHIDGAVRYLPDGSGRLRTNVSCTIFYRNLKTMKAENYALQAPMVSNRSNCQPAMRCPTLAPVCTK